MQQFFVSKTLAAEMTDRVDPRTARQLGSMCWYGHWVPVADGGFTLLMEVETRYCMVFHNLTKHDFLRFEQLFSARLWREVLALCQLKGVGSERMGKLIKAACSDMQFGLGLDYGMSNHVYEAVTRLQAAVASLGGYPVVGVTEFGLGIKLNQEHQATSEHTDSPTALNAFRELWLRKLHQVTSESTITAVNKHWPENVIELAAKKPARRDE